MPKWDPTKLLPALVEENPSLTAEDVRDRFPDANAEQIGRAIRRLKNPDSKNKKHKVEPPFDPEEKPDELETVKAEVNELRKTARTLQRKLYDKQSKTQELIEAVYEAAKEAAVIVGAPSVTPPPADHRTRHEEVALLHVTDWQVGKETEDYNSQVAAARVDLLTEKVLKLTAIERAAHPVRKCVVLMGGDMCEGVNIFPGQPYEVDSMLFSQVFATALMIESMLRSLAGDFEEVEVVTAYGNHGRLGRKGDYKRTDNIDVLLYTILKDRMKDVAHLDWTISHSWYQVTEIGNYRALLVHGDQFKSFGGQTPAFGIAKKVNAWASGVIENFTDAYIGHFHQPLVVPMARGTSRAFMTPSIESGNQYATEFCGASGTPAQRLHFIDPERGRVTTERLVYLDEVRLEAVA